MSLQNGRAFLSLLLLTSLLWQAIPARAMQTVGAVAGLQEAGGADGSQVINTLLRQGRGDELNALLEKLFGDEAAAAASVFDEGSLKLIEGVAEGAGEKARESLEEQIRGRRERPAAKPLVAPDVKTDGAPKAKPLKRPAARTRKAASAAPLKLDWRQLAFGFRPLPQEEKPDIKVTETEKEIKASGEDKKSFETKEAKGTRTQKAETRYLKDGKTFGVEIKNTQVIEAVSKADGKSFRQELSLTWGAQVAACPDAAGLTTGTGMAKVISKTVYTEGGAPLTMTSEFDLQAKLTGYVNDDAVLTHYDLQLDAYTTSAGQEEALRQGVVKEIKLKDGRYGLHYDIRGNTIEVSDGTYGGKRTPAKLGKAEARKLTPMTDAETTLVGSAIGPMVPSIWNSANEMYKTAERHWKNYGCVEVVCRARKLTLKPGEEVEVSAETVHLSEGGKISARLKAEAYNAQITPETQRGEPGATFTLTQEGEESALLSVESVSKRGIGKGDVEFQMEKEEASEAGGWTGTITVERKQREEREKRSGANLAENGGHLETTTQVQLRLTGRLDRSVDATNAHIAPVTGEQVQVDYEYDRYKLDEGHCGPGAVPYKGPKEITRTSTTTVNYGGRETRVYVEGGQTGGTITFSLPEVTGKTLHAYVHKSPCAEHDRANTNEATDEDAPTVGGSFSFSFPIDPSQRTFKGTVTIREQDGSTTTYTWELTRNTNAPDATD